MSLENSKINFEKKFKSVFEIVVELFRACSAKKVSYAIAIPTINNRIAKRAFSPELSILSPSC